MKKMLKSKKDYQIKRYNDSIVYSIGRLYIFLNQYFTEIYKEFGLNPAQFNLLMLIKHFGGEKGVSQIELGDKLFVSAANITKLIDRLEKKGIARRFSSKKDRRVNLIKITEKGSKLLDKVWKKHVQALNNILEGFSEVEKKEFNEFLERFKEEMRKKLDKDE